MEQTESLLIATLAATFMLMFLVWLLSLALKDASIVDIFWGSGFALIAVVSFAVADGFFARKLPIQRLR